MVHIGKHFYMLAVIANINIKITQLTDRQRMKEKCRSYLILLILLSFVISCRSFYRSPWLSIDMPKEINSSKYSALIDNNNELTLVSIRKKQLNVFDYNKSNGYYCKKIKYVDNDIVNSYVNITEVSNNMHLFYTVKSKDKFNVTHTYDKDNKIHKRKLVNNSIIFSNQAVIHDYNDDIYVAYLDTVSQGFNVIKLVSRNSFSIVNLKFNDPWLNGGIREYSTCIDNSNNLYACLFDYRNCTINIYLYTNINWYRIKTIKVNYYLTNMSCGYYNNKLYIFYHDIDFQIGLITFNKDKTCTYKLEHNIREVSNLVLNENKLAYSYTPNINKLIGNHSIEFVQRDINRPQIIENKELVYKSNDQIFRITILKDKQKNGVTNILFYDFYKKRLVLSTPCYSN